MIATNDLPTVAKDLALAVGRGRLATAFRIARTARNPMDLHAQKIISRRYGYVWLSVPKVASTSLTSALRAVTPDAEVLYGLSAAQLFARWPETRHYYRFAVVRHPFTRALSFHTELHRFATHYRGNHKFRNKQMRISRLFARFHGLAGTVDFDDYCRWLLTPYASDAVADRHFSSQHMQIDAEDGRPLDFIGRFEHLEADFSQVLERLGLPKAALPQLNTMAGWQSSPAAVDAARSISTRQLTAANKALLAARYAEDLNLGGYAPE